MNVAQLLEVLADGELSGTALVNENTGLIKPEKQAKVIGLINRGLTQLHTAFLLREQIVTVQHMSGVLTYDLNSKHSAYSGTHDYKYILDSEFVPFTDNVIEIEFIKDEVGRDITINEDSDEFSYYTPGVNKVQVDTVDPTTVFHVIYKANHAMIDRNLSDLTSVNIELPDSFLDALCLYVASKQYSSINSTDSRKTGMELYQLYVAQVQLLKSMNAGIRTGGVLSTDKRAQGWV